MVRDGHEPLIALQANQLGFFYIKSRLKIELVSNLWNNFSEDDDAQGRADDGDHARRQGVQQNGQRIVHQNVTQKKRTKKVISVPETITNNNKQLS